MNNKDVSEINVTNNHVCALKRAEYKCLCGKAYKMLHMTCFNLEIYICVWIGMLQSGRGALHCTLEEEETYKK